MKRVMETVIPKGSPVQKPSPVVPSDFSSTIGRRMPREETPEKSDPVEQAKLGRVRDEQEKIAKIQSELARMRREDKEGYELLLNVVKAMQDPAGESRGSSLLADASPAIRSLSTNQLIMRALFEEPVRAPKRDGNLELSQGSGSKDSLLKGGEPVAPSKSSESAKIPEKGTLPSSSLPSPVPPSSTQPRWESWRNVSSRESSKPYSRPVAPPSDSWRTGSGSSSSSTSWRNDLKNAPNSRPLTAGLSLPTRPLGGISGFDQQRNMSSNPLMRSPVNIRGSYGNRGFRQ
ncbi:hypothetical protein OSTOST_17340 [Ostertagia ostertagi]